MTNVTDEHEYVSVCRSLNLVFFSSSSMIYHRIYNQINTTVTTSDTGNAYPSGEPDHIVGFVGFVWLNPEFSV